MRLIHSSSGGPAAYAHTVPQTIRRSGKWKTPQCSYLSRTPIWSVCLAGRLCPSDRAAAQPGRQPVFPHPLSHPAHRIDRSHSLPAARSLSVAGLAERPHVGGWCQGHKDRDNRALRPSPADCRSFRKATAVSLGGSIAKDRRPPPGPTESHCSVRFQYPGNLTSARVCLRRGSINTPEGSRYPNQYRSVVSWLTWESETDDAKLARIDAFHSGSNQAKASGLPGWTICFLSCSRPASDSFETPVDVRLSGLCHTYRKTARRQISVLTTPLFGQAEQSENSWTGSVTGIKLLYIPAGTF